MTKEEVLEELQNDIPDDAEARCAGILLRRGDDGHIWTRTDCTGIEYTYMIGRLIRAAAEEAGVPPTMFALLAVEMAKKYTEETKIDMGMIKRMMRREDDEDDQ